MENFNFDKLSEIEKMYVLSIKDKISKDEINYFVELYNKYGEELMWNMASINKTIPEVSHSVLEWIKPDLYSNKWLNAHETSHDKNSKFLNELDRVTLIAHRFGIQMCLIENGSIIRTVYECPGCFSSGDLDVLVLPGDIEKIDKMLLSEGYTKVFRHADNIDPMQKGWQVYKILLEDKTTFYLNIQWVPVLLRWLPIGLQPSIEQLFQRSIEIKERETKIRILSNEDNLFILALHTASHSYIKSPGFRLHLDVERWVKNIEIDWDKFIRLTKEHYVCRRVFTSLYLAKYFLNTPIPDYVINDLSPPPIAKEKILSIIEKNGLFNPDSKKFSKIEYILFDILLTDGNLLDGILNAFFPSFIWMKYFYSFKNPLLLPYYYLKRFFELGFKKR